MILRVRELVGRLGHSAFELRFVHAAVDVGLELCEERDTELDLALLLSELQLVGLQSKRSLEVGFSPTVRLATDI